MNIKISINDLKKIQDNIKNWLQSKKWKSKMDTSATNSQVKIKILMAKTIDVDIIISITG